MESELKLNSLRVKTRVGCSAGERSVPQTVRFDLVIRFAGLPKGAVSDHLEDTICYATLSTKIEELCKRETELIERLAQIVFDGLKPLLPKGARLGLTLTKEAPPMPFDHQGVSFTLQEWALS